MLKNYLLFIAGWLALLGPVSAQVLTNVPQSDTTLSRRPGAAPLEPERITIIESNPDTTQSLDSTRGPRIILGDISHWEVCPGSTLLVPFTTEGTFGNDNAFSVQLVDATGNFIIVSDLVDKGPIEIVIPPDKKGGLLYRLRIIASNPKMQSEEVPLRLMPRPHARLETADGSTSARIMPGQEAQLRVNLSGSGPWTFQLSDGTIVRQTLSNPYYFRVKPDRIQAYTLLGVSNACGSGTVAGNVIVNVDPNPEPRLALKDTEKGLRVCTNTPFQVAFSATGRYRSGNNFVVQIADRDGVFRTVSSADTMAPILAQIPMSIRPGQYRLRVASSSPVLFSDTTTIVVAAATQAILQNDTLRLKEGGSGELTVRFQGGGPWFVLLSDGTYENNILMSPHTLKVTPYNNTRYQITSAGGLCGVGDFSGTAYAAVELPPSRITMGTPSQTTICAGTEIDIPYTAVGRFYAANKFIVQIEDGKGNYVDLPTTGKESPLKVKITPTSQRDTISIQRIRIMATAPGVISETKEISVIAPNAAVGEVSGQGTIAAGGSTRIRLRFKNGLPPWSFTLSDGTTVQGTFLNPYLITVSPTTTTEFTLSSLKNACGVGTSRGSATIKVER
ncbi:hypothetical protein GCM10027275_33930 [Rhabdobacter roseus]|uniref:Ig-like domain-containing protein n=1 Tax=Rhabdobacter roseus TaxID=1655419 RepID=A0A840TR39_9BACT|nr:hypothetical protein [Rhabdobacter roseus]MBB5285385.1 hypothetical protein [Rhabdobacter roseus]